MKTNVTYKISSIRSNATYINEYWDDILVYKWRVAKPYYGGNIREFLEVHAAFKLVNYDGLDEYHRRTFILNF